MEVVAVAVGLADAFTDTGCQSHGWRSIFFCWGCQCSRHRIAQAHLRNQLLLAWRPVKRLLLTGGVLRSVEWHRPIGDKDVRGRQAVSVITARRAH